MFIILRLLIVRYIQLLRPDFAGIVAPSHKHRILSLVGRLIKLFGSSDIAVDDRHTPKLYSRFLAGLVTRYSSPQEEPQTRAVPKIESSPMDTAMPSLPDLSMSSRQLSRHVTQPADVAHMGGNQYGQTQTLPTHYAEVYSSSSASGTITQFNMEESMPEVPSEDLLASMQAINNPMWWEHVMMPGFTWPDSGANTSTSNMGSGDQQQHPVDPYAFVPHDPLMQHEQRMG